MTNPWIQVAQDLDSIYSDEYLFAQAYSSSSNNIMEILIPPEYFVDKFGNKYAMKDVIFGTKVLNLFVAQATYGWTPSSDGTSVSFTWGDPNSSYSQSVSNSIRYWLKIYPLFTHYKTLIWTDLYSPKLVQDRCPYMASQMSQTDNSIQQLCKACPGFTYMGQITSQVPASFFQPYIDQFYGNPAYRAS